MQKTGLSLAGKLNPMTTVPYPTPLDQYYPGVVIRGSRIVRLGRLKGISLDCVMRRLAAELGMSVGHLHCCFITCSHRRSPETIRAILTAQTVPLAYDAPRRS